jgi:Leucine-rich repeat (LRR) protein
MKELRYLYLYQNVLTGSLPESLGELENLELFSAYDNHLTGPLVTGFSNMSKLNRLLLQNNRLTGSINNEAAFAADMLLLEIVDLSNNKLSGRIPRSIFSLPRVTTVALSLNCFRGDLPPDLCGTRELQVLSMDGLGGAQGCKHEYVIPITGVSLFNTLDGTVPACLWRLKNLTVLHLASNGLVGSIMQRDYSGYESSITDLSLGTNGRQADLM